MQKIGLISINITTDIKYSGRGRYTFSKYDDGCVDITYDTEDDSGLSCTFKLNSKEAEILKEFLEENYCEDCKESSRIN